MLISYVTIITDIIETKDTTASSYWLNNIGDIIIIEYRIFIGIDYDRYMEYYGIFFIYNKLNIIYNG